MSTSLDTMPAPVRNYFTAMNALDSTGMVAPFTSDGLVNDIQREFWGPDAIKRWADRESIGDKVVWTAFPDAKAHHGDYIVSAEVDGEYDKTGLPDPLVLTYYFSLENDKITRLIISGNKPGY
jgi:hypothetical protein